MGKTLGKNEFTEKSHFQRAGKTCQNKISQYLQDTVETSFSYNSNKNNNDNNNNANNNANNNNNNNNNDNDNFYCADINIYKITKIVRTL